MKPGRLIALEGIDGAGTTTQTHLLVDWIEQCGVAAHFTCEPSTGPMGGLLRQILTHQVRTVDRAALALLFASDRVDHLRAEIAARLDQGIHVISDRYVYSSLAYQSMDLEPTWVAAINSLAPEPDLTVYLRVDPEVAAARRSQRGGSQEEFETNREQSHIASIYDSYFGSAPCDGSWQLDPAGSGWIHADPGVRPALQRLHRRPTWAVVDGTQPVDRIQDRLRKLVPEICTPGQLWHSR